MGTGAIITCPVGGPSRVLPLNYKIAQLGGEPLNLDRLVAMANEFSSGDTFSLDRKPGSGTIILSDCDQEFIADPDGKVLTISLKASGGITTYARITQIEYALIAIFGGLLLGEACKKNPYQTLESFFHTYPHPCILSDSLRHSTIGKYIDGLYVCPRCASFFSTLEVTSAFNSLVKALELAEDNRISRSLKRRREQDAAL